MPFTWTVLQKLRMDLYLTQLCLLQSEKKVQGIVTTRLMITLKCSWKAWVSFFKSSKDLYLIFSACALVSLSIRWKQFYVSRKKWMKGKETLKGQRHQSSVHNRCAMSIIEQSKSFAVTIAFSVLMVTGASKALGNSLDTIRFFLFSWKRETVLLNNTFFFFGQYWFINGSMYVSCLQHLPGRVQVIFKKTAEEEGEDCKSRGFWKKGAARKTEHSLSIF